MVTGKLESQLQTEFPSFHLVLTATCYALPSSFPFRAHPGRTEPQLRIALLVHFLNHSQSFKMRSARCCVGISASSEAIGLCNEAQDRRGQTGTDLICPVPPPCAHSSSAS
jgi:hypothetical protein